MPPIKNMRITKIDGTEFIPYSKYKILEANYDKALKDVVRLSEENKELKAQIAEYDDLTEELDYRKREAKRLGWNSKDAKEVFNK